MYSFCFWLKQKPGSPKRHATCFDAVQKAAARLFQFHIPYGWAGGLWSAASQWCSQTADPVPSPRRASETNKMHPDVPVALSPASSHCSTFIDGFNTCHYLGIGHSLIICLYIQSIFLGPGTLLSVLENNTTSGIRRLTCRRQSACLSLNAVA